MERRRVVVHGFVQGVGFRFAVEREDVEALVDFCRRGPRGAEVDRVDVAEESPEGLAGFRVGG